MFYHLFFVKQSCGFTINQCGSAGQDSVVTNTIILLLFVGAPPCRTTRVDWCSDLAARPLDHLGIHLSTIQANQLLYGTQGQGVPQPHQQTLQYCFSSQDKNKNIIIIILGMQCMVFSMSVIITTWAANHFIYCTRYFKMNVNGGECVKWVSMNVTTYLRLLFPQK